MNLYERLRLFPGGLKGLAQACQTSVPRLYRFVWREHSRRPVELAVVIAAAVSRLTDAPAPLAELGDMGFLLELWDRTKPNRIHKERA